VAHLEKYRAWVDEQLQSISLTLNSDFVHLDTTELFSIINSKVEALSSTSALYAAKALYKISTNIDRIFSGEIGALDLLHEDDLLNGVEVILTDTQLSGFLSSLSHSKPNLRVLELGAGTGSSTARYLSELRSSFSKYHATDGSTHAVEALKERFKDTANTEFAVFDISRSREEQAFEDGQYDLIIASNVFHQVENISEGLLLVQSLLKSDGYLLLQELSPSAKWTTAVLGILPDWSRYAEFRGSFEPTLNSETWAQQLAACEFKIHGADPAMEVSSQLNAILVAQSDVKVKYRKEAYLLVDESSDQLIMKDVEAKPQQRGYDVSTITLGQKPADDRDIISLLDVKKPFLEDISEEKYIKLQTLITTTNSRIFWPTKLSQIHVTDPRYGQIVGFARTIRNELGIDFAVCQTDLDFYDDTILDVFENFASRQAGDTFAPEAEFVVTDGHVYTGRYYPDSIPERLISSDADGPAVLTVEKGSRLRGLHWRRQKCSSPKGDEVQIEVHYMGLNRRVCNVV